MVSALCTLLVDFMATAYYERKEGLGRVELAKVVECGSDEEALLETGIVEVNDVGGEGSHAVVHGSHSHSHHRDDVESTVRHLVVSQVTHSLFLVCLNNFG